MRRSRRDLENRIERWMTADEGADYGDPVAGFVALLRSEPARHDFPLRELTPKLAEQARTGSVTLRENPRDVKPLPMRWRRRAMLSTFLSTLVGKILLGSVALAATTSGLAATGHLPDPAQAWAAENLAQVGIEIPAPDGAETQDQSGDVLQVIEGTDPADRDQAFGEDVGDTASEGISSDSLEKADEYSEGEGNVADQFTPAEAEEGNVEQRP